MNEQPSVDWAKAIPAFLRDGDHLCSDEHLRLVTFPELAIGLYLVGGGHLFLGTAIGAWRTGVLARPCPRCDRPAQVIYAGGSPFSGSGNWRGWCPACGMVSVSARVSDLVLNEHLRGQWARLGYQPVIHPGDPWRFDFRLGAVHAGAQREALFHFVPGWKEFMEENYPDCLLYRNDHPSTGGESP
jgi:hypothetical protein